MAGTHVKAETSGQETYVRCETAPSEAVDPDHTLRRESHHPC
jgi:hypothetical protein